MTRTLCQSCSFDVSRSAELAEYDADLTLDVEQRIGLYATNDDGTSDPYVTTRIDALKVEFFDDGDVGYAPLRLSREVEVPWRSHYLIATWTATLTRCERVDGRKTIASYKIELE